MAGIIPVAGLETDFDQRLPEVMMPVNAGFTAIQKSVYECALVGCQTIWIVANNDLAPIIRATIGEWIYDPVYYNTKMGVARKVLRFFPVISLQFAIAAFLSPRNCIKGQQLFSFLRW